MSIIPDNFNFTVKFLIFISKIITQLLHAPKKEKWGKTSAEKKGGAPFHTYATYLQKVKCWIHLKVYLHYYYNTLYTFRKTGPCIMYLFHNHYSSAKMCTCTSRRSHSVYSHGLKMHIKTWYGWKMINW